MSAYSKNTAPKRLHACLPPLPRIQKESYLAQTLATLSLIQSLNQLNRWLPSRIGYWIYHDNGDFD